MKQTIPSGSFKEMLACGFKRKSLTTNHDSADFLNIYKSLLELAGMESRRIPSKETVRSHLNGRNSTISVQSAEMYIALFGFLSDEWARFASQEVSKTDADLSEHFLTDAFGGLTCAVMLWGTGKKTIKPSRIFLTYNHSDPKVIAADLPGYNNAIEEYESQSGERKPWNGLQTRLISHRVETDPVAELDAIHLTLGRVRWYDYIFLNKSGTRERINGIYSSKYLEDIGWNHLVKNQSTTQCKLSNIIETATTLITQDGWIGYRNRGRNSVSSAEISQTSAIQENILQFSDVRYPGDHYDAADIAAKIHQNNARGKDGNFIPERFRIPDGTVLDPIATVIRSLDAEGHIGLWKEIRPNAENCIRLTGLSFDVVTGHPNLLFLVLVDTEKVELEKKLLRETGDESEEGIIRFVPATFGAASTKKVLKHKKWSPAGKASFVRALQVFSSLEKTNGLDFHQAFKALISGTE